MSTQPFILYDWLPFLYLYLNYIMLYLDKTQLVGGSWWIPQIGFQPNSMSAQHEWEICLRSNEGISWIKIHPLTGIRFYSVMFSLNIFPLKLFIFIVNIVVASLQKVKCSIILLHDVTVNTHYYQTIGRCCLGNYVMSQCVTCHWHQGRMTNNISPQNPNLATHHSIKTLYHFHTQCIFTLLILWFIYICTFLCLYYMSMP